MNEKSRACPALGITCYLEWCLTHGMCKSQKGYTVDEKGASHPLESEMTIPRGWKCPHDTFACSMVKCNGGETCYAREHNSSIMHYSAYGTSHKAGHTFHPPCHSGMSSLGFINKAEIMVGTEVSAKAWIPVVDGPIGLVLGLLGDPYPQLKLVGMNDPARDIGLSPLDMSTPVPPNIWVRWPDYGAVPFDRDWWLRLVDIISGVNGAVLIYCMGGHGRSGTAATIVSALGGLVPEGVDPVAWIRNAHCNKAVESLSQIKYIEAITGLEVHEAVSKPVVYSAGASNGSKKNRGGEGGVKSSPTNEGLSKKKWKTWWRRQPKTGEYCGIANITRPVDLPDGQTFTIGQTTWKWSAKDDMFKKEAPA